MTHAKAHQVEHLGYILLNWPTKYFKCTLAFYLFIFQLSEMKRGVFLELMLKKVHQSQGIIGRMPNDHKGTRSKFYLLWSHSFQSSL